MLRRGACAEERKGKSIWIELPPVEKEKGHNR
jgi:hypothetical protein